LVWLPNQRGKELPGKKGGTRGKGKRGKKKGLNRPGGKTKKGETLGPPRVPPGEKKGCYVLKGKRESFPFKRVFKWGVGGRGILGRLQFVF